MALLREWRLGWERWRPNIVGRGIWESGSSDFFTGRGVARHLFNHVYTRETRHFGRSIRGKADVYRARSNFWIFVKSIRYRVQSPLRDYYIFMIFFFLFERLKVRKIMGVRILINGMFRYLLLLFFFYFVIFPRIFKLFE